VTDSNSLQLVARVAERDILRYTPAGIPIVTATLEHASTQREAGYDRQIEFELSALAAGEISGAFNRVELGGIYRFTGFLAKKSRNSRSLVFHIVDFAVVEDDQQI
jgi:primosomal replication protein N